MSVTVEEWGIEILEDDAAELDETSVSGDGVEIGVGSSFTEQMSQEVVGIEMVSDAPSGPRGPVGLQWRGAWSGITSYNVDDAVTYGGSSYRRKIAGTSATLPTADTTNWELLAAKGDKGDKGDPGTVNNHTHDTHIEFGDALFTTNAFGGKQIYQNHLMNAFYRANERWAVTGTVHSQADDSLIRTVNAASLFDSNYETNIQLQAGEYLKVVVDFAKEFGGYFPGYPYGKFFISNYYQRGVTSARFRAYTTWYVSTGEWREYDFAVSDAGSTGLIWEANTIPYQPRIIEFYMYGQPAGTTTPNNGETWIVQIDWYLNRPGNGEPFPVMRKDIPNTVLRDITFEGSYGPVVKSADGSRWRLRVDNTGTVTALKL